MKKILSVSARLLAGIVLAGLLIYSLFAIVLHFIPTWGASPEEAGRVLPGDELTSKPTLFWTNAISINAPPAKVWPWIAQLGDTRGGFYSYTFIENRIGALTGAEGYQVVYVNANEIHPEWQNPQAGDPIIQGSLKIRTVEPKKYLLADSITPEPFLWVWGWYIEPLDSGAKTRLLVRFAIEVPDTEADNPVMGFMLSVGGFVMQQNMLQGIKLRAEGLAEPAWLEWVEIAIWVAALICGLVAMGMYLFRSGWLKPLLVAIAAMVVLFVLTFVQPGIIVRVFLDASLVAGFVWASKT